MLLDPTIHTPEQVLAQCPFLFTVSECSFVLSSCLRAHGIAVCAVSSRYYPCKSEVYPAAMSLAKREAEVSLNGRKSVELAQAYILLSIYAMPVGSDDDHRLLYISLAIRCVHFDLRSVHLLIAWTIYRIAMDLDIYHMPIVMPTADRHAREILNKTRLWISCFNWEQALTMQLDKPSNLKED